MAKVFFSYCHVDEAPRDRLEVHLSLLKQQGLITTWHDRRIAAGDNVDATIDANLNSADIILLLVSADFIASRYCYSIEMKRALERDAEGSARVIPVILDECDWHSAPFGKLLAVPKDGKAVTTWPNQAQAWTDATRQIRAVIEAMRKADPAPPAAVVGSAYASPAVPATATAPASSGFENGPRSSNLRLKKSFSDFDKDKFLHDSYDYMAKFFENSLGELESRNAGIQTRFQRRDAQSFSAVVYREGKSVTECSVRVGGFGARGSSMLTFSYDANSGGNSFNEMLNVEADDQSLFFKSTGMQFRGGAGNGQLSEQGASELYWGLFLGRLQ
ncbi:hypothetical protein RugamoR64_39840 [Duganella rhizosphaerae]|uniref:toll/interleukin-1 receptor domain-containing protein n=1 Tax=Duganella rhizosphaerae TaxID=2885763 RepID=UPI0030EB103A